MHARIEAIEYHLPERKLSTSDLVGLFPDWKVEKLDQASGIRVRHIAAAEECASDLAVKAAEKLFASGVVRPEEIDFLLLCTQSPDYLVPTTACLVQDRLGIPTSCGALDYNLGHSGYVYGLGLAEGLIASHQVRRVLLLTAETYSKYVGEGDRSTRTIFGDAAAATLLTGVEGEKAQLGPFLYGSDGRGGPNLIVPTSGKRRPRTSESAIQREDENGNRRSEDDLYMNGAEIFSFTLSTVSRSVEALLARSGHSLEEIDLFVFHQANRYILEHLRKRIGIPSEKFALALEHCGNTVSSSIPIALHEMKSQGRCSEGTLVMLVGYGAGYSWGATLARW